MRPQVIVSADRGLYADWLFSEICALNWHHELRINHQGTYQIKGEQEWRCLDTLVPNTPNELVWCCYLF